MDKSQTDSLNRKRKQPETDISVFKNLEKRYTSCDPQYQQAIRQFLSKCLVTEIAAAQTKPVYTDSYFGFNQGQSVSLL
jgi:hypothetical protein